MMQGAVKAAARAPLRRLQQRRQFGGGANTPRSTKAVAAGVASCSVVVGIDQLIDFHVGSFRSSAMRRREARELEDEMAEVKHRIEAMPAPKVPSEAEREAIAAKKIAEHRARVEAIKAAGGNPDPKVQKKLAEAKGDEGDASSDA